MFSDFFLIFFFFFSTGLRTPALSMGSSWFRRIWKVNPYIVYSYGKNAFEQVKYFVWDETVAQKGADEVISVCHQHIKEQLTPEKGVEHLIIHFDGCYGQANNSIFLAFCAELVDHTSRMCIPGLERITLKRNPVGHTFCECENFRIFFHVFFLLIFFLLLFLVPFPGDTAHGMVQKAAKDLGGDIHIPYTLPNMPAKCFSWEQVIKSAGKGNFVRHSLLTILFVPTMLIFLFCFYCCVFSVGFRENRTKRHSRLHIIFNEEFIQKTNKGNERNGCSKGKMVVFEAAHL